MPYRSDLATQRTTYVSIRHTDSDAAASASALAIDDAAFWIAQLHPRARGGEGRGGEDCLDDGRISRWMHAGVMATSVTRVESRSIWACSHVVYCMLTCCMLHAHMLHVACSYVAWWSRAKH
jgi:hypothetical protein